MVVVLVLIRLLFPTGNIPEGLPFSESLILNGKLGLENDLSSGSGTVQNCQIMEINCKDGIKAKGEFQYRCLLASDVFYFRGEILVFKKSENGFQVVGSLGFSHPVWEWRAFILKNFKSRCSGLDRNNRSMMQALLLGIRDMESKQINKLFREAGCSHLLALSGFHLAYLAFISGFILSVFFGRRFPSFCIQQILMLAYTFIAGAGPSLIRAFIMRLLRSLQRSSGIFLSPYRAYGAALFWQIMIFPQSAGTVSFQLSYAAIGGILFYLPVLDYWFSHILPRKIFLPFAVSLAAAQFSLPFSLFYFGSWTWCGLLFSLILSPLILFYMSMGLVYLIIPVRFLSGGLTLIFQLMQHIAGYSIFFRPVSINESSRLIISLLLFLFNLSILAVIKVKQIVRIRKRSFQFKL